MKRGEILHNNYQILLKSYFTSQFNVFANLTAI